MENNPTDLATRNVTASGRTCSEIWWQGPKFLKNLESEWPENLIQASSSSKKEFRSRGRFSKAETNKGQESTLTAAKINESCDWRLKPQRFSSWTRLAKFLKFLIYVKRSLRARKADEASQCKKLLHIMPL